jgi:hypothetical protein
MGFNSGLKGLKRLTGVGVMKEKPLVRWSLACFVTAGNSPHDAYQELFLNNTQNIWHYSLQSSLLLLSARPI